jgi:hypothetical protein
MLKASAPFLSFIEHHWTTHHPSQAADWHWRDALETGLNRLVALLSGSSEPQVTTLVDRGGQQQWHVYDPVLNHHHTFTSEQEVRVWLEQRYYQ